MFVLYSRHKGKQYELESNHNLDLHNTELNFILEFYIRFNILRRNMKLIDFLSGKKTIIGIVAGSIYSVLIALNYVEDNQIIWTLIAAWTGISFRLALKK